MNKLIQELEEKIIHKNHKVSVNEAAEIYGAAPLEELCAAADRIRKIFCSNKSSICSVINAKQGACTENCRYCAQSAHWNTNCRKSGIIDENSAAELSLRALEHKVSRISLVTAGKALNGTDFEKATDCIKKIIERTGGKISVCASFGILDEEKMTALKKAGVSRYHHNLETSINFFPEICTTHTYQQRVNTVLAAKKAGLEICCGGIIGMGESRSNRIELAAAIRELEVQSVPINVLSPIQGTPLENSEPLSKEEILRTFAVFRFLMPEQTIRCAAGRKSLGNNGKDAFTSGANALISGDFLTIHGSSNNDDIQMLMQLGYEIA